MAEAHERVRPAVSDQSGARLTVVKFAIDSGYATPEVYEWTRKNGGGRVVVIKGDARAAGPVSQPSPVEIDRWVNGCASASRYGR